MAATAWTEQDAHVLMATLRRWMVALGVFGLMSAAGVTAAGARSAWPVYHDNSAHTGADLDEPSLAPDPPGLVGGARWLRIVRATVGGFRAGLRGHRGR